MQGHDARSLRDNNVNGEEAPFAYAVVHSDAWSTNELRAVVPTLAAAVAEWEGGHNPEEIVAYWRDGRTAHVPREAYQRPAPADRDGIVAFIRKRAADIARSGPGSLASIWGIGRCNPDDPEEKQIEDYIRTEPWIMAERVDEDWWHAVVPAVAGAARRPDGARSEGPA